MPAKTRFAAFAAATLAVLVLTGCGLGSDSTYKVSTAIPGVVFHGSVFGGQQAVVGATIKLYATGSTGYGSAYPYTTGDNLLGNNTVTTTGGGASDVTGDYTCPSHRHHQRPLHHRRAPRRLRRHPLRPGLRHLPLPAHPHRGCFCRCLSVISAACTCTPAPPAAPRTSAPDPRKPRRAISNGVPPRQSTCG